MAQTAIGVAVDINNIPVTGVYTPVPANQANLDSLTMTQASWTKTNDRVIVFGGFLANPTAGGIGANWTIDLPFASDLLALEDLSGCATQGGTTQEGTIVAETVGNRAYFDFLVADTSNKYWSYIFSYRII
jgi:hypothetical protein